MEIHGIHVQIAAAGSGRVDVGCDTTCVKRCVVVISEHGRDWVRGGEPGSLAFAC